MEIIRVDGNVRKSIVAGILVNDLPKGLRRRMVKMLNKLKGVKRICLEGKTEEAIFEYNHLNATLDLMGVDAKLKKEIVKTIDLFKWYRSSHWRNNTPGLIGGTSYCVDCNFPRPPGGGTYCVWNSCSSHRKWRQIIGPKYTMPPKPPKKVAILANLEKFINLLVKNPDITDILK